LSHLNLVLASLEVRVGGTWRPVTLDSPGSTIDVLAGSSQAPLTLATNVPWPAGADDAIQFDLGPNSTVQFSTDAAGASHNLASPGSFVTVMGLPGSFSISPQTNTDLWITFDVESVVQPDPANDGGYVLFPGPIRGYDKGATGSITGTLTSQAVTGPPAVAAAPLQGAVVTAQLQAQDGDPGAAIAFRTAVTDANGNFTLDTLPKGYTWCAVSLPVAGTAVYYPQASAGLAIANAPYNTYQTNLAFLPAPTPGSVAGTVNSSPPTGQEDVVDLIQEIPIDGIPYRFVLSSAVVGVASGGGYSFSFPSLPPGIYSAVCNDYFDVVGQGLEDQPSASPGFIVSAGSQTGVNF
jgi:hypothetical protein